MNIEIITTPNNNLKETGFGSRYACYCVLKSLLDANHNAVVTVCKNIADLAAVIKRKPDLVIIAVKYIVLENGQYLWLSEYFENQDVRFTGSPRHILAYDSNKVSAKKMIAANDIKTANFFLASPHEYEDEQALPLAFPLFIKPLDSANGNGIDVNSLVHDFEHFQQKIQQLYDEYAQPILVEEYLEGKEFTVAVIENHENLIISAVEIIPPEEDGLRILGAKVKTGNTEVLQIISDPAILSKVIDIAEKSFQALGAKGFGRIDIKMDTRGDCHFIEANLVPGMKKGSSYFPQAYAMNSRLDYDEVVGHMIQGAVDRVH